MYYAWGGGVEQNIWRHQKIMGLFQYFLFTVGVILLRQKERETELASERNLSPFLCCKDLSSDLWLHFQVLSVFLFFFSGNLHQWIVFIFWNTTEQSPLVGFILYFFNEKRGENFRTFEMIHAYTESTLKKYSACTEPTRNVNLPELEILNSSCLCWQKEIKQRHQLFTFLHDCIPCDSFQHMTSTG